MFFSCAHRQRLQTEKKKKKRKREIEKLNFIYGTEDVTHNSLVHLLAPNVWFYIDSGFVDYINSDHGFT